MFGDLGLKSSWAMLDGFSLVRNISLHKTSTAPLQQWFRGLTLNIFGNNYLDIIFEATTSTNHYSWDDWSIWYTIHWDGPLIILHLRFLHILLVLWTNTSFVGLIIFIYLHKFINTTVDYSWDMGSTHSLHLKWRSTRPPLSSCSWSLASTSRPGSATHPLRVMQGGDSVVISGDPIDSTSSIYNWLLMNDMNGLAIGRYWLIPDNSRCLWMVILGSYCWWIVKLLVHDWRIRTSGTTSATQHWGHDRHLAHCYATPVVVATAGRVLWSEMIGFGGCRTPISGSAHPGIAWLPDFARPNITFAI